MNDLPRALYRAADVRELDRIAIEEVGIPGYTLMSRAGEAAWRLLRARWPRAQAVLVVAGPGNNGGDGYVIARLARAQGMEVEVLQLGDADRIRGDALRARSDYLGAGGLVSPWSGQRLVPCDVIVDALLGTGLEREVGGAFREVIAAVNAHPAPVLAVDIPSGLHSDTGMALGIAVRADLTVSFIGLKQGLFTGMAADHCGSIAFDDLGVPPRVYDGVSPSARRIVPEGFGAMFAPRARCAHKGNFGHVLVVGGDRGMSGAARMAGEAAARTGAGLVSIATRAAHAAALNLTRPELMVRGVESADELESLLARATVVALGPGLGQGDWSRAMLGRVLQTRLPLVGDADALNLVARAPGSRSDWILTPHPGEAARLLGTDAGAVQGDRFAAAKGLQQRFGGVVVLKGAGTLVADAGHVSVCSAGNPGMASGGMGDVLSGIIAALLAQGHGTFDAAQAGVCIHAGAADAAARTGERGLLASDLFPHLRRLVNP